jgi:chromosome segregation ATPase
MDLRYNRKNNNADWESSFTHILQRTRQNLDKISSKPGLHAISTEHNYARAFAPINDVSRGASPARLSIHHFEANENCNADSINRAQDMAPNRISNMGDEKVASLEQSLLNKHESLEEQLRKENALLKERILANERTGEQCVNSTESHTHEIKELQRIYANQALQISRQNSMLDGINQELDSRRSQISKMDSWIRQEEIWRHDIEDQLNVLNKRVKSVERTSKENKDVAAEMNMKLDSLEQLLHSNSAMSSAWTAKTEAFMRRMEKQRQLTNSLARGAEEGEEEEDDSTRGTPSKNLPPQRGQPTGRSSEPMEPIDPDELFVTPASLMYKQGIIREVEVMLGSVENKVTKQMRSDYQADLAESSRHLRIEIQNYLYRMSADAGLAPPSFGGGETNNALGEGRSQSPSKRESVPTTTYGKVALNQQVDAMHYRLEDMCSAMAVVKEDAENNHSSLQHSMHSLENRLDEINITNQANVGSIQSRSAHIEEIVRSFEVQFYKQISDAKEDMLNKLRDNTMGANDDRAALDRRLAIMENIISTFSEKNKVSNDAIDAYFASSAEIKKFDMVSCVKLCAAIVTISHNYACCCVELREDGGNAS